MVNYIGILSGLVMVNYLGILSTVPMVNYLGILSGGSWLIISVFRRPSRG